MADINGKKIGKRTPDNTFWPIDIQEYDDRNFVRYLVRDPSGEHVVMVGFAEDEEAAMAIINPQIALITITSETPEVVEVPPPGTLLS